jgi:hypothetical protein
VSALGPEQVIPRVADRLWRWGGFSMGEECEI